MDVIVAMMLASEEESTFMAWIHTLEPLVALSLTFITGMLTWVTYLVHKDSVKELGKDNDNMHDVAVREIDSNNRHLAAIREMNRISRKNRRGINY